MCPGRSLPVVLVGVFEMVLVVVSLMVRLQGSC